MLDNLIILFISGAAIFVAYRAMAVISQGEAPPETEADAKGGKRKPNWAAAEPPRTKRKKKW